MGARRCLAPARGELRVSFSLPVQARRQIETELRSLGHSEPTFQSSVIDASGALVAELLATYVIRRITPGHAAGESARLTVLRACL